MLNLSAYPILSRLLIWIMLPVLLSMAFGYVYFKQSLPKTDGTIDVEGLSYPVKIMRDKNAIPNIVAATDRDAFFAMGYVHAQDRLFQMVYQRRLGQGRLSEVFGSGALDSDRMMRTLRLYEAARKALHSLDGFALDSLKAYADGVNAWMNEDNTLPVEFYILNFKPEKWKPEDSLLIVKLLALNLDTNYREELVFDLLVKELGIDDATELMPNYSAERLAVGVGAGLDLKLQKKLLAFSSKFDGANRMGGEGYGSNSWVVSGALTQSGKPLLANDPHLATEIPSFSYLAQIRGDRISATGMTIPGIPFIVFGFNEHIAWGGTSLAADVQDLYVVRSNLQDENQYEIDGEWFDMDTKVEWIHIRPNFPRWLNDPIPPIKWTTRNTRHGPLISDVIGVVENPIALRWTALSDDDKSYQAMLNLNYARNWIEFKAALNVYVSPTLNFIYADKEGNIGSIAAGRIPVRNLADGNLPVPGWNSEYEWSDYIPQEGMPQNYNPESGLIVHANNNFLPEDYPYRISNNWQPPYRAKRITEVIEAHVSSEKKITRFDFEELQGDYKNLQAAEILEYFDRLSPQTAKQVDAIQKLSGWDGFVSEDSAHAAIYQSWIRHFSRLLVEDDLRGELLHAGRSDAMQGFVDQLRPQMINHLINQGGDYYSRDWCNQIHTTVKESCEQLALLALDKAINELNSMIGNYWQWGEMHEIRYTHRAFSNMQVLGPIFDRKARSGGDAFTVNVGGWSYSNKNRYQQVVGAAYRQIVDLENLSNSVFITNTGQSGNIFSSHYSDHIQKYKNIQYLPMKLHVDQNEIGTSILTLKPVL